jgi:hypothetical protein
VTLSVAFLDLREARKKGLSMIEAKRGFGGNHNRLRSRLWWRIIIEGDITINEDVADQGHHQSDENITERLHNIMLRRFVGECVEAAQK